MIKYILGLCIAMSLSVQGMACEACGCSITGSGMGLLTAYRNNTLGLSWFYSPFRGSEALGSNTRDYFHTVELFGNYHITPRLQVSAFLPYRYNNRVTDDQDLSAQGLSDLRIVGSYTFFDNKPLGAHSQLYWDAGAGVRFPTGRYDEDIYQKDLPDNFNVGNGAWSLLLQSRLLYKQERWGASATGNYQVNSATSSGYRFGDQLALTGMLFVRKSVSDKLDGTLFGGVYYERIGQDDYPYGKNPHTTGGEGYYAMASLNVKWNNCLFGASYSHPFSQNYSEGEVIAKPRISANVAFIF
ncbi:MAG: hypothetical protein IPL49_14320 [Saprospirales bacterium]|nr:hypothetical protein [Saprospirales bacterium]MBK8492021.1 hypothetical protein [Saprospirales bacterium]